MALVAEVLAKVRRKYPDMSARWGDSHIGSLIHAADCMIKEEGETDWSSPEITLLAEAMYYPLPTSLVSVRSVEYSIDGTNFDDGVLWPTTFDRLDCHSRRWKDDTGIQPRHYLLMSAPGVENFSKIMVWQPLASVTAQKIRVNGIGCYPSDDAAFQASSAPEWVQDAVYVPLVCAMLHANVDAKEFKAHWDDYTREITKVRTRFRDRYAGRLLHMRGTGPTLRRGHLGR